MAELAKILDPAQYGPAFYSGGQAEFVVPDVGVSSLLLGYDAVWMQTDLSLGVGMGGDPVADQDTNNLYNVALRLSFPVHRGVRADYAIAVGGGATFIDPPDRSAFTLGTLAAGAKFRVFMAPNVAAAAALGVAAFIHGEHSSLIMGARPLGSASVIYFFR
jgi:hypothetical protein